jgi:hypothetical protein
MEYTYYARRMRKIWLTLPPVAAAAVLLAFIPTAHGDAVSANATVKASVNAGPGPGVGPQFDAPHIYLQHGKLVAFEHAWVATFGGTAATPFSLQATPTPSRAISGVVFSPVATLSTWDYSTPIPYPFGTENIGEMMANFNEGLADAERSGATVLVAPFKDPVGKDVIVQFPGGINMQLWKYDSSALLKPFHPLKTIPDSRFYLDPGEANAFIRDWLAFSHGYVAADDRSANGAEIGMPGTTYRKVLIESTFGETLVIVSSGQLPYPFGRETMGYAVPDLTATLAKATAAGAHVLYGPFREPGLATAMVQFPGGYICEIHQGTP